LLNLTFREPPTLPPWEDSLLDCLISSSGNDDVLLILGVNILVRDNDLAIEGFSPMPEEETSGAAVFGFSTSAAGVRYLKLSFGSRLLMADFPLDVEGPGEVYVGGSTEREVTRKFTLLGVGVGLELGVGGILIATKSWELSSVLEGISRRRFCLFRGGTCKVSSVIPIGSSTYKEIWNW